MYKFGKRSMERLETCDERIQRVAYKVIEIFDHTVLEGRRGETLQNFYFDTGKSTLKYPDGKHNKTPSLAIDVAPWFHVKPHIRWSDKKHFIYLAGLYKGIGHVYGVKIRWGGNWDNDNIIIDDQNFIDLPHLEISL